ncbi:MULTISPECIES: twin-arginine translocase TatA/TatE family subunit [unclassified Bdellovibrio]|uniref:Sec-independent protein translocase subunit TatA/TatB n=1 Tax=unclassified Bdellovibrio TaxID=2633795 RepID=UPI00115BF3A5|nr:MULTISPECIES: twin-arginine translocase TatA/TatE family subunit [unclassified Bdellovibrio]QDK45810.1 twin-arginine translocase TatA/TatE family subunit [Bdellovibrio sp. ZAP7]QLY24018.1 twin-arginine translocase TatA/TatE family subunit [Bdellovibrio sp. KM01]
MGSLSLTHLLLIALVFLVFFGPSKLPQLGSSLGQAIRGFKKGLNEIDADEKVAPQQVSHQQNQGQQMNQTQTNKEPHNS